MTIDVQSYCGEHQYLIRYLLLINSGYTAEIIDCSDRPKQAL